MVERCSEIYTLSDPRDNEVRYIGHTVKALSVRLREHLSHAITHRTHKANWIRQLVADGVEPRIEAIDRVSSSMAPTVEREWIAKFKLDGARLTNATDGGEGNLGWSPSAEARAKIAAAHIGRKHPPRSEEYRRAMSERKVGRPHPRRGRAQSKETRDKIAAARRGKGRPHTPESRAKIAAANRKPKSQEHVEKLRIAATGRRHTPEARAKMSAFRRGVPKSDAWHRAMAVVNERLRIDGRPWSRNRPRSKSSGRFVPFSEKVQ